jgi:N-acetylglutamate synthase-like GNAT family acetyltransferase
MEPIVARKATAEDAPRIARLYELHFPEHIMVRKRILTDPGYIREKIADPDHRWAVAGDDVYGVAALAIARPVGLGEIERVCVDARYRNNGIGGAICGLLLDDAKAEDLGFVEAFARGTQYAMQRTFQNLGLRVYGISPRFEIMNDGRVMREQFVHMGIELKPETVLAGTNLISPAKELQEAMQAIFADARAYD